VRLLLADEVGVGKTLSLAGSALVSSLLGDGPVLILCPATLTTQWQMELKDKLNIPSVVWLSSQKAWQLDPDELPLPSVGAEGVANSPDRDRVHRAYRPHDGRAPAASDEEVRSADSR
jgi:SNF2-related domain